MILRSILVSKVSYGSYQGQWIPYQIGWNSYLMCLGFMWTFLLLACIHFWLSYLIPFSNGYTYPLQLLILRRLSFMVTFMSLQNFKLQASDAASCWVARSPFSCPPWSLWTHFWISWWRILHWACRFSSICSWPLQSGRQGHRPWLSRALPSS